MKSKILLLLFLPLLLTAQYKKDYDIDETSLSKTNGANAIQSAKTISNEYLEVTMLEGGYFTIGTTNGYSESPLDDNCQITFGHPYAKTSYPIILIDYRPYNIDEIFENTEINIIGDSLQLVGLSSTLFIKFSLVLSQQSRSVEFNYIIKNKESNAQNLSCGVYIDPALGKWGDAYFESDGSFADFTYHYNTLLSGDQFSLWERRTGSKGIRCDLNFDESSNLNYHNIYLMNWHRSINFEPIADYDPEPAYDLVFLVTPLLSQIVGPDSTYDSHFKLSLEQPDFSSTLFTRWDLPQFFTIDNGIVFPNEINSFLEVYNPSNSSINITSIYAEEPPNIITTPLTTTMNVSGKSYNYANVKVKSKIIYEDKIADVAMVLQGSSGILDVVSKRIFIPQTHVSEEGLTIVNDSINTSNLPNIDIVFSVDEDATGKRIRALTEENVFLYENGLRIDEFEFGKFTGGSGGLIDVVFVLDISGSMGDEITAVKNNLNDFGQSLADNDYDYQIGVITFSTTVTSIWDFTNDLDVIRSNLSSISLWGGVEDSPSGLMEASNLSFRNGSKRTIIWITDESYPEHNYTKTQVVDRMLEMGIVVHGVGLNDLQTSWFDPIVIPTGGNFYDINGNFRDILLDVSNVDAEDRFLLSYQSASSEQQNEIKLEVRYAGFGGNKIYSYNVPSLTKNSNKLSFFPNPFNPSITLNVNMNNYKSGKVTIFNILGQVVKEFNVIDKVSNSITWNAVNSYGQFVSTGFYLVQLTLQDFKNKEYTETAKILYLK